MGWREDFVQNKRLFLFPFLGREFTISFDLYLEPKNLNYWKSVIHFTTGTDPSRIPAIFIHGRNHFAIVMQKISHTSKTWVKSHTTQKIEMSQKLVNFKARRQTDDYAQPNF